jgi:hypothetical protein
MSASVAALTVLALAVQTEAPIERRWLGADGNPIELTTDDEILEFLRTARVVSEESIGTGINDSKKLLLERDGVRMNAVFREVEIDRRHARIGDRVYQIFRDSYRYEPAAYELSRLLGLHNVPPATSRTIRRRRGSVQIWLQRTLDETADEFSPLDASAWAEQLWVMNVFDILVFNVDRNAANVLVDPEYKVWLIDHTRAFQVESELLDESVVRVERRFWDALVSVTDDEIRNAVDPYLDSRELRSLLERRTLLVAHIRKLLADHGEKVIFY